MRRTSKKILLYGVLMAAGVALGMQLVSDNSSGGYTAQTPSAYEGKGNQTETGMAAKPQENDEAAVYEQGTYVKLKNGETYYYVQNDNAANAPYTNPEKNTAPDKGSAGIGSGGYQTPGQILLSPAPETTVDRFADKTGELLQTTSQKGINWIVSLFSSLTD